MAACLLSSESRNPRLTIKLIKFQVMLIQITAGRKASKLKFQEIINQLSAYTCQKQLPTHMKIRLLAYYYYRFRNSYFREKNILSKLSGTVGTCRVVKSLVFKVKSLQFRATTSGGCFPIEPPFGWERSDIQGIAQIRFAIDREEFEVWTLSAERRDREGWSSRRLHVLPVCRNRRCSNTHWERGMYSL